jgi:carboxyl-terminal processing protease
MLTRNKLWLVTLLLVIALLISFGFGYGLGLRAGPSNPAFASIEQVWNIILADYVDKDRIDVDQLSQAAIEAMVELLDDPYTSFLESDTFQLSFGDLEGIYEGIGAEVAIRNEQLTIIAPFANSPAAEAGVRAGDVILEIDGEPTEGLGLIEAVAKVRGPEGTQVRLLILHPGETETVEVVVIRGEIAVSSVFFEMRGDIAYIRIDQFTEKTNKELTPVLEAIATRAATGIVLDLRSNPGGQLDAVVDVTSRFLEEGLVVVSIRDNKGNEEIIRANRQPQTTDLPILVLVNSFSASGSEVLSGAFQDHGRAIIAGTTTFGKGSVNLIYELADGSGLYITAARWLTPDGNLIEGEGIFPDVALELAGEDAIQWAIGYLHGNQ